MNKLTENTLNQLLFSDTNFDQTYDPVSYDLYAGEVAPSVTTEQLGVRGFDDLFGLDPLAYSGMPVIYSDPPVAKPCSITVLQDTVCRADPKEEPRIKQAVTKSLSLPSDSAARKRERNRLAAERCRQRRLDLISQLQLECDQLKREREQLLAENERLLRALGLQF